MLGSDTLNAYELQIASLFIRSESIRNTRISLNRLHFKLESFGVRPKRRIRMVKIVSTSRVLVAFFVCAHRHCRRCRCLFIFFCCCLFVIVGCRVRFCFLLMANKIDHICIPWTKYTKLWFGWLRLLMLVYLLCLWMRFDCLRGRDVYDINAKCATFMFSFCVVPRCHMSDTFLHV